MHKQQQKRVNNNQITKHQVQCRRNVCYCVDENGSQESSEEKPASEKDTLTCASAAQSFCE